jgi:4-amino-4-deoxy-L-arabinose transferase-like glycosyltransferase
MTSLLDALVAFLVAGALNAFIVRSIRRRLPGPEAAFLSNVYMATLVMRMALAVFLNAYSGQTTFANMFWGDSSTYDHGGWVMSMRWGGDVMLNRYTEGRVSGWGFFYFVGALYYVFGRNQLLVQFVNGTIGALTVVVIYAIAKHLFDVEVAQWAARFMAFFPQVVFWSGAIYKDPAVMFCIAVCMYAVLKLSVKLSLRHVGLFVAAALVLMSLRFYVFYFVAFATLSTFVLAQRRGVMASVASYIVVFAVFLGAFAFAASRETLEQQKSYLSFERLQITRADQAMWGQSALEKADVSTPQGALAALPTGLVYLLFAPFPWALRGIRQMLTLPETLVWYALWPALIRGLMQTFRHRVRQALPILVFAASLTIAYAVFQGNVGTAYRQRTQVTMFYFIFMAAGLVHRRRMRAEAQARAAAGEPAFQLP